MRRPAAWRRGFPYDGRMQTPLAPLLAKPSAPLSVRGIAWVLGIAPALAAGAPVAQDAAQPAAALPYSAASPALEPSAAETLSLELINRFRADPAAEGLLLAAKPWPREPYEGLDIDLFVAEMAALEPAQPLVYHPRLIGASRNHLAYTLAARDYGHDETPGPPEFTGAQSQERALFAGYPAERGVVAECAGSYIHGGILGNHWSLLVDDGPGGDHGMQAGRGHRMSLVNGRYREFGNGSIAHPDGRWGEVSLCSPGADERLVGGVAYLDLDGDRFYDIGEGVGGLAIECEGGGAVRTWASGAYRLEAGGPGELVLRATLLDLVVEGTAPTSSDNFKFDVELSEPVLAHWRGLVATLGKSNKTKSRRALLDLAVWTEALPQLLPGLERSDPAPSAEVVAQVAAERGAWQARRDEVLVELRGARLGRVGKGGDLDLDAFAKDHRGTLMGAWFTQASELAELIEAGLALEASRATAKAKSRTRSKLEAEATELATRLDRADLRAILDAERVRLGEQD